MCIISSILGSISKSWEKFSEKQFEEDAWGHFFIWMGSVKQKLPTVVCRPQQQQQLLCDLFSAVVLLTRSKNEQRDAESHWP